MAGKPGLFAATLVALISVVAFVVVDPYNLSPISGLEFDPQAVKPPPQPDKHYEDTADLLTQGHQR